MGDEASQIRAGDSVALQQPDRRLGHLAHGEFIDGLPVLVDVVHLGVDGLVGWRIEAAAPLEIERYSAGAVDFADKVDDAELAFGGRLDQYSAPAVAEQNTGGAIGVVGHAGVGVRAAYQHLRMRAALYQPNPGLQRVDESRTASRNVESPSMGCADLV